MNFRWFVVAIVAGLSSGCQCCPWFDSYANTVDDVNDTHFYFDKFYNPRFDITRMGKPDWCSPFNNFFCSRCCKNYNNACYDRYDDCYLYPPLYPYELPSNVMPPPTYRNTRIPRATDEDQMPSLTSPNSDASPNP